MGAGRDGIYVSGGVLLTVVVIMVLRLRWGSEGRETGPEEVVPSLIDLEPPGSVASSGGIFKNQGDCFRAEMVTTGAQSHTTCLNEAGSSPRTPTRATGRAPSAYRGCRENGTAGRGGVGARASPGRPAQYLYSRGPPRPPIPLRHARIDPAFRPLGGRRLRST